MLHLLVLRKVALTQMTRNWCANVQLLAELSNISYTDTRPIGEAGGGGGECAGETERRKEWGIMLKQIETGTNYRKYGEIKSSDEQTDASKRYPSQ